MPRVRAPTPPRKETPLHLTNLPNDSKSEVIDVVLVILKRRRAFISCPVIATAAPNRAFWAAIPPHISQLRRRVTVQPKGILFSHVETDQGTCFHCFGWDAGPEFNQLTKVHRFFLWKEEEELAMRPILPRNISMRQSCVLTHTIPRVQIRPNTFPQRFVPHLWHHAWALSAAGHRKPRLFRHILSDNLFPFQNIARVRPPRASDLENSFLKYRWTGSSPKPCCMVVPHVLFVDDESRGDCICQFACFLFHATELSFHIFLFFPARSSFDLRHRPSNPLGAASPPKVAQSFQ